MDFDGDGRLDLLSGSNCCDRGAFHLFRRKADGSWAPNQRLEMAPPENVRCLGGGVVTVVDWNGDGVPDLLSLASGGGLVVGLGPFPEGKPIPVSREIDLAPREYVGDFAVADWDRDGKPDLVVRQVENVKTGKAGIYWYRNLGGPGLTKLAERKLLLEITRDMHVYGFCVCDWSGDGYPGLIVTRQDLAPGGPDGKGEWRGSAWFYPRE